MNETGPISRWHLLLILRGRFRKRLENLFLGRPKPCDPPRRDLWLRLPHGATNFKVSAIGSRIPEFRLEFFPALLCHMGLRQNLQDWKNGCVLRSRKQNPANRNSTDNDRHYRPSGRPVDPVLRIADIFGREPSKLAPNCGPSDSLVRIRLKVQ